MNAPTVAGQFNATWFHAALAYYGHPVDFPGTFRPNPAGYLEHCNAAPASRAGTPVWTTVNTPIPSHLRKKAANDEIVIVSTITLEGELPADPPRAHALCAALRAELIRLGLIAEGVAIEDSGAGFHFALPIPPITVADFGGGVKVNAAVSLVVHAHIMPVFNKLAADAGLSGVVTLGSFDISRVMSLPGTWRPGGMKSTDGPALANGYQRCWLAPHDVTPPVRVESPALGYLIRQACSMIPEIHGSWSGMDSSPMIPEIHGSYDAIAVGEWLRSYAEKHSDNDRSKWFHRVVCAASLKYGAAIVEDQAALINEVTGDKYSHNKVLAECRRSLAKAPTKTELRSPYDPRNTGTMGSARDGPMVAEIHGQGVPAQPAHDGRNTRIMELEATVAKLQSENSELRRELVETQTRLDKFEAEETGSLVRREEARAEREAAAHRALVEILEHPDLTFRQRVVTALAKDTAGAYIPRVSFGGQAAIPPPKHVPMGELEQRAGIASGSAAQSLKPAAALGIISREAIKRNVTLPGGIPQVRTEVMIGPGTGKPQPNWHDRKREAEAERARAERAERKSTEERLVARIDELEAAEARAEDGCTCGGELLPTGYFCASCQLVATPKNVVAFPRPIIMPPAAHSDGTPNPMMAENVEPLLNSTSAPYLRDHGEPVDEWLTGGKLSAF